LSAFFLSLSLLHYDSSFLKLSEQAVNLKELIRNIPDFPKKGIQFKDIESIVENPEAFTFVTEQFADALSEHQVDKILALDARGFLFGAALAYKQKLPLVMARKKGKLAGECVSESYALEYGDAEVELQKTAVSSGDKVLVINFKSAFNQQILLKRVNAMP